MGNYKRGTSIGKREQVVAKGHALKSLAWGGTGVALGLGTAGAAYTGEVFSTLVLGNMTGDAFTNASRHARAYGDQMGHAKSVEGVIAKSRGGSPALGMRGVVPKKQSAADRMRSGAEHLGGPKQLSHGAATTLTRNSRERPNEISHGARAAGLRGLRNDRKKQAADAMRSGAMHLGGGLPTPPRSVMPDPGAPALAVKAEGTGKRTVADKYDHSTSKAGERIMDKARGERMGSKFFKGVGHALGLLSPIAAAGPEAPVAIPLTLGGSISAEGAGMSLGRTAENMRLKSRAVDSLVMRGRTGNTMGVPMSGEQRASFNQAQSNFATKANAPAPKTKGVSLGIHIGWGNKARANSAAVRGANWTGPSDGFSNDGTN